MSVTGIARRARMTPLARREARQGLLFLTPWLIGFVALTALPMAATLAFSFSNIQLSQVEPLRFVGLDNYQRLINDRQVWHAMSVTLRFAVIWLPVAVALPFVVALLLNARHLAFRGAFRALVFLPYVVPFVAGVLAWQSVLALNGWLNQLLRALGVAEPPAWLQQTETIYPALAIMGIWGIGAGVIINLAGLRGIPTELYDAARIDGAGWWGQLRHVTIPLMTPIFFYSLVLGIVGVMQYFLVPIVLNNGTGAPGGSTMFYNLYLFKTFFTFSNMSYGATLAWFLFAITLAITLFVFWSARYWVHYAGER